MDENFDIDQHEIKQWLQQFPKEIVKKLSLAGKNFTRKFLYTAREDDCGEPRYKVDLDNPIPRCQAYTFLHTAINSAVQETGAVVGKPIYVYAAAFRECLRSDDATGDEYLLVPYNAMLAQTELIPVAKALVKDIYVEPPVGDMALYKYVVDFTVHVTAEMAFLSHKALMTKGYYDFRLTDGELVFYKQSTQEGFEALLDASKQDALTESAGNAYIQW